MDQAYRVMMTAYQRGVCVIAVYTQDVAETKAKELIEQVTELGIGFIPTQPQIRTLPNVTLCR